MGEMLGPSNEQLNPHGAARAEVRGARAATLALAGVAGLRARVKIAVIGCGTAGAASALFLSRAGHAVTVFERVPEPKPVGAGIVLQPTGQAVLARLGLADEVIARGARIDRLHCRTSRGRTVVDLAYAVVDRALFGLGMHRGALFDALFRAVQAASLSLHLGMQIDSLVRERGKLFVAGEQAGRHGPFELVIVADGAVSELHDDTNVPKRVRPYAYGALWYIGPDETGLFRAPELRQVVRSTDRMLGWLPTGLGPDPAQKTPLVTLFWSLANARKDDWAEGGLEPWKDEIRALHPESAPFLEAIRSPDQVLFTAYREVVMRHWHTDDVVYVGDAAHATSPQLGNGCNLALVDALVLSECLARFPDVRSALSAYSRLRQPHVRFYQLMSRWLTPFFQSDRHWLGSIRDLFMPLACWLPPIRNQMVRTMTGIQRGLVRPSLVLPDFRRALPR